MIRWTDATVAGRLHGVDLDLAAGSVTAIVGPNGAGKTTLLRAALGLVPLSGGQVHIDGRPLGALSPRERAAALAWLPQVPRVAEPVPVVDLVATARYRLAESGSAARAAALRALTEVGASALATRAVTTLSGGERQRVALACLVAQEARAWLLDEPGNHLDPAVQIATWRFLGAQVGPTRVVVTHDLGLLPLLAGAGDLTVVGMLEGRVTFRTPLSDPGLPDALASLYGVRVHRLHVDGQDRLLLGAPR